MLLRNILNSISVHFITFLMEIGVETIEYGGKVFTIPKLSPDDGIKFEACESSNEDHSEQINLNLVWDYKIVREVNLFDLILN